MRGAVRLWALVRTAVQIIRREGMLSVIRRLVRWLRGERGYHRQLDPVMLSYADFKRRTVPTRRVLRRQRREDGALPLLLITVFTGVGDLDVTAESILAQTSMRWQWVILRRQAASLNLQGKAQGDERIRVIRYERDAEILSAVNDLLRDGTEADAIDSVPTKVLPEYVVFIDTGDALTPDALYELARTIRETPGTAVVYSDGEIVEADGSEGAILKPDWSPEMMLSVNLLEHAVVFNRSMLVDAGGVRDLTPVAGRWELGLRISRAREAKKIIHVPRILYRHVREADVPAESCAVVIAEHLRALGVDQPKVEFIDGRSVCSWKAREEGLISIIIPTRDLPEVLSTCLESIYSRTRYKRYEIILVDTGSTDRAIPSLYERYIARGNFRVLRDDAPFNFSRVCNIGARAAQGELLLFLNNDTEVLGADWLDRMAQWFALPGVGMVGAKLLYPNGLIQHAGVIVGIHGLADNFMAGLPEHSRTVFGSDDLYRNLSAVTGACAMISRDVFEQVGGFDERYRLNFSDVQLGVEVTRAGYRVVYTPDVRLIHHESLTHQRRIPEADIALGKKLLASEIERDPFYHPNLNRFSARPSLSLRRSHRF